MICRGMTFMLWSHVRPMMALKGEKSSTIKNCTFLVIGPTWTGNTMSPKEVVVAQLNQNSIRPGFSRTDGESPICLQADICKRLAELPGSTKTLLTSNPLIPNVGIRAFSCGCMTRLAFIGGKVIMSSTEGASPFDKLC